MHAELDTNVCEQALNGIHLPPCPAILMAVMKEAWSADADLQKIARLAGQDVGLSAPMLKLANSPYFGLRNKASSIQQAIVVLGLRNTVKESLIKSGTISYHAVRREDRTTGTER